ncbi:MAG TPA: hypothetical protein VFQ88_07805 [Nevskiaceae bacterium]|nr:hypothetical protein [Nevskiaceae bacterium]
MNASITPNDGYRIVHRGGCTLIFGAIPVSDFAALTDAAPEGAVLDFDLARMAGATSAFGMPDDCSALRALLAPQAEADVARREPQLSAPARHWLAVGQRGRSANAIFHQITGIDTGAETDYPHDVGDFARCRLLLEQVSQLQHDFRARMPAVSASWAGLVDAWDSLCASMDAEVPQWREVGGRFPETSAALEAVLIASRHNECKSIGQTTTTEDRDHA